MAPTHLRTLQNDFFASVLTTSFSQPVSLPEHLIMSKLRTLHPSSHHVPVEDCSFQLSAFLKAKDITFVIKDTDSPDAPQEFFGWNHAPKEQAALYSTLQSGVLEFEWEGIEFLVYKFGWQSNIGQRKALYDFVFGDKTKGGSTSSDKAGGEEETSEGEKLVTEVYRWQTSLKDEMWVFQDGAWQKDKEMWRSIQACSWDDLVLEGQFQQGLVRDTETFFSSKEIYQSLGITWKRGMSSTMSSYLLTFSHSCSGLTLTATLEQVSYSSVLQETARPRASKSY